MAAYARPVVVWPCGTCGSGNDAARVRCWVCGAGRPSATALSSSAPGSSAAPRPATPQPLTSSRSGQRTAAWFIVILAILFLSLLIGIELALQWPGMLIPFGLLVVVVGVGVGALMRAHFAAALDPARASQVAVGDVLLGASTALATASLVVLGLLALVVVCALVLFYMLCGGHLLRL